MSGLYTNLKEISPELVRWVDGHDGPDDPWIFWQTIDGRFDLIPEDHGNRGYLLRDLRGAAPVPIGLFESRERAGEFLTWRVYAKGMPVVKRVVQSPNIEQ